MTVAGFAVKWGAGRCDVFVTGKRCGSEILRAGGVVGNLLVWMTMPQTGANLHRALMKDLESYFVLTGGCGTMQSVYNHDTKYILPLA